MAKKRGAISPLGNAPGSKEAQKSAAKQNLSSLTEQLKREAESAGVTLSDALRDLLGDSSIGKESKWTLASGKKVLFTEVTLTYEEVVEKVFVRFEVNGRDQDALTKESLSNLDSMEHQQYYPAVARMTDGKIEILDGSRRCARFKLAKGKIKHFRLLVTGNDISISDAKALAKSLQSAKEHTIREIGKRCLIIEETAKKKGIPCTQADIANELGYSQAKISRARKVAEVQDELVGLFPIINDLNYSDYMLLNKIQDQHKSDLVTFFKSVEGDVKELKASTPADDIKDTLLNYLKAESLKPTKKLKPAVTQLHKFGTKGVYARKKVKGREFSYEFSRISETVQKELDSAINEVLKKYL
jgi:ParB family chromosome partitioning protein